ncbi:MAG TPA: hypothetical protein VK524_17945 [Polyangiaceae bacterium]|nr:hypothetical protein [Polyangiaceae bacterium]
MRTLREQVLRSLSALMLSGLLLPACPALLGDDFETVSDRDASVGGSGGVLGNDASDSSSGSAGRDGSAGSAGSSGSAGASGASGSSGMGGSSGTAGATDGGPDSSDASVCATCDGPDCAGCSGHCCDGQCIDVDTNTSHCGECGKGCPGTACLGGHCVNQCLLMFLDCDKNVATGCEANASTDSENCGSCGIACGFDATCSGGTCQCPADTANCDGQTTNGCEADLSSDKANCGACRQNCGTNQYCSMKQCVCETGFADCNGRADDGCEASLSDTKTCGSCTKDCGSNSTCTQGVCGCSSTFNNCDALPGCESPKTSPEHCGSCIQRCEGGTPVCNGTQCVSGCATGETLCNGVSCVNLTNDPSNCGTCGRAVGANQTCVGGVPTCRPDFSDCNLLPGDGCEVDLRTDAAHCGSCTIACKPGAICSGSSCSCAPATPNDCTDACRQCCDNTQCSDGNACTVDTCSAAGTCTSSSPCASGTNNKCCGGQGCYECCDNADCTGGKVCSGNQCVTPACTLPNLLCNGQCIDPDSNVANCGGCNIACTAGRTCLSGGCGPKWLATPAPPPGFVARSRAAFAWTGSAVFIWGGASSTADLNSGALYNPSISGAAAWSLTTVNSNTPSARVLATAVWTGSVLVVWGGGDRANTQDYNSGSIYDPVAATWTKKMKTGGAPSARRGAFGVWTGSRVLIWGGYTRSGDPGDHAYLYDPVNDAWSSVPTANEPDPALNPATGWSGTHLYTFGGLEGPFASNDFRAYSAAGNAWSTPTQGPSWREGPLGGFDGSYFVVWGGRYSPATPTNGMRFDPTGNAWSSSAVAGAPSARYAVTREHGWVARISAGKLLMLGGFDPAVGRTDAGTRKDGTVYTSTTNSWAGLPAWPSGHARRYAVAIWMGSEFLLWGGENGGLPSATGERLFP